MAFPLLACDAAALQRRLYEEYRIEAPIIVWNGRQLVRVSVQECNTEKDVDALERAFMALLPERTAAFPPSRLVRCESQERWHEQATNHKCIRTGVEGTMRRPGLAA